MSDPEQNSDPTKPQKHNIYPFSMPPPPPDGTPVRAIGINKCCDTAWDISASHLISFSDKSETYGKPLEGKYLPIRLQNANHAYLFCFFVFFKLILQFGQSMS